VSIQDIVSLICWMLALGALIIIARAMQVMISHLREANGYAKHMKSIASDVVFDMRERIKRLEERVMDVERKVNEE